MTHDDKTSGNTSLAKTASAASREARLAKALRANLRKRKAQARARRTSDDRPSRDEDPGQT